MAASTHYPQGVLCALRLEHVRMSFHPVNNMPDYTKWSREELETTVRHYHQQVVAMHDALAQVRLDLRAALAENRKLLLTHGDNRK